MAPLKHVEGRITAKIGTLDFEAPHEQKKPLSNQFETTHATSPPVQPDHVTTIN
jgi:hypothetical protein